MYIWTYQEDSVNLKDTYSKAFDELEHDLRRDIYRRQMLPGEKLSSELQLARKYRISRSTVRKALDSLAEEGLITRVRGSGTFVADKKLDMRLHSFSPTVRNRQILFLSFSTVFSEETLRAESTFGPIFDGLGRVLNAYRYNLLIGHVNTNWQPPACLLNGDVAGIVFHGWIRSDFCERWMADLPCVGLQHVDPEINCSWVCINNYERSYLAVRHLFELGHRKIAFFLRGMEPNSPNEERLWGFRRAMRHFGLPCPEEYCIIAPSERVNGERRPDTELLDFSSYLGIFTRPDRPTALIIQNNLPAFAFSLGKLGLRVPDDVSIVSGHNKTLSPECDDETYICDRFTDVCAEGGRLMIEQIENEEKNDKKTILLSPVLCQGNSTKQLEGNKR